MADKRTIQNGQGGSGSLGATANPGGVKKRPTQDSINDHNNRLGLSSLPEKISSFKDSVNSIGKPLDTTGLRDKFNPNPLTNDTATSRAINGFRRGVEEDARTIDNSIGSAKSALSSLYSGAKGVVGNAGSQIKLNAATSPIPSSTKESISPLVKPTTNTTRSNLSTNVKPALTTGGNEVRFIDSTGNWQTTSADIPQPKRQGLNNSYSNEGVQISSPTMGITDSQKDYLDKTLEYNRRPEVIAGFAKNAALSQARYDDYFNKSSQIDSRNEEAALRSRLSGELSKNQPNRDTVSGLNDRLNSLGSQNSEAAKLQAASVKTDNPLDKAQLELDYNKHKENLNKDFLNLIKPTDGGNTKFSPLQAVSSAKGLGSDLQPEDFLSHTSADPELISRLGQSKDKTEYKNLLMQLGIFDPSTLEIYANNRFDR